MKSVIRLLVVLVVVGGGFGCANGSKIATILPVGESTEAKPAPVSKGSEEIIAPKSETPPAPVASPEPSTPPALPTPPKAPDGGTKTDAPASPTETPPALPPPAKAPDLVLFIPWVPAAPKQVMRLTDLHPVECVNCSESDSTHEFRCPSNYVVTGFRFGEDAFDVTPDTDVGEGSIETFTQIVGGLRIVCSRLEQDHVRGEDSALASYLVSDPETTVLSAVTFAGKDYGLDDTAVNCPIADGVATGVIGRVGGRLDSFGLTCGLFLHNDTFTGVFPAAKETITGEESVYGGMPGNGGAPFDVSCDVNEVIVGLNIASGEQVNGLKSLTCAKVSLVDAK